MHLERYTRSNRIRGPRKFMRKVSQGERITTAKPSKQSLFSKIADEWGRRGGHNSNHFKRKTVRYDSSFSSMTVERFDFERGNDE